MTKLKTYAEACHPGARGILEKIERLRNEDTDEYWLLKQEETQGFNAKTFITDIFLLLKTYTTAASTARSVVMNTRSGYGTLAGRTFSDISSRHWPRVRRLPMLTSWE